MCFNKKTPTFVFFYISSASRLKTAGELKIASCRDI